MRLFIAISVPKTLHQYCRQLQSQFDGLKKTSDFHITLQFLGDGIESSNKIQKALNQIKFEPFEIEMGDIVPFGPKARPRGIWIECNRSETLEELVKEVHSRMIAIDYESDRPFRPHITLGRYKRLPKTAPKRVEGTPRHLQIDHFELIQSHLGENGPHYKTLQKFG